jgi:ATP-binding cassette subfamily C (CFTR/MRP) protein 1
MASLSPISCSKIDDTIGPHAATCRGGFDFTLLFEESILSILPLSLMLIILPIRLRYLLKRQIKVSWSPLLPLKLVGINSTSRNPVAHPSITGLLPYL